MSERVDELRDDLKDINTQFHLNMENYQTVYANYKLNPTLPSAMSAHDKTEANLILLYRRMFVTQAAVDKQLEDAETTVNGLTTNNTTLNTALLKQEKSLASLKTMPQMPVKESFIASVSDDPPPTPNQLSMVKHAKTITNSVYYYSIARIIYLLVGISVVSYFIFQTIGAPESTILADVKMKADQLKSQAQAIQPALPFTSNPPPPNPT
jgi:hypothetical protein